MNTLTPRGGLIMRNTSGWSTNPQTLTRTARRSALVRGREPEPERGRRAGSSRSARVRCGKPVSNLSFEFNPSWYRGRTDAQFMPRRDRAGLAGAEATGGIRYVFAQLDQSTLQASLRMDYSDHARAVGAAVRPAVHHVRRLLASNLPRARPRRTSSSRWAPTVRVDFNYRSVRGNAVLRVGSTCRARRSSSCGRSSARGRRGRRPVHLNARSPRSATPTPRTPSLVKVAHHFTM